MSEKIDLSGVHHFWEIVDIYKKGDKPNESKWDELFDTPGYDILTKIEFSEDFFRKVLNLAYGPNTNEILGEVTEIEKRMIKHLNDIMDNRKELNDFLGEIFTDDYYDDALDLTFDWLPFEEQEPYPPVSFLFFQEDARGYIPIVFDLQFAYELGDDLSLFLAHEMHHFYRNMEVSFDPEIDDKEIIWAINQIHMEGVADNINSEFIFGDKEIFGKEYQRTYLQRYRNAEEYIQELDEHIKDYRANPDKYREIIKADLPLSGHPIGFFMAESIIDSGRKDELIENYDDPFYFFELYNKSAELNDYYRFSEDSIDVVNNLKKKYT